MTFDGGRWQGGVLVILEVAFDVTFKTTCKMTWRRAQQIARRTTMKS